MLRTTTARQPVRVSRDGADASAYDVMRHIFGWGRTGRPETLRALAVAVRATGFALGSRTLPGGGKPTVTFAVGRLDEFLVALQEATTSVGENVDAVDAYRKGPHVVWLAKHLTDPTPAVRRKDTIASRSPLSDRHRPIRPASEPSEPASALVDDTTRDAVRHCGDIILAALRTARAHTELSKDEPLDDGEQDSPADTGRRANARDITAFDESTITCGGTTKGHSNGCDTPSPADRHFVETRALPLASAARPLRVWCTGERVGVRMCAVWPTASAKRWGVSLPRSDGTIDVMGTVSRAIIVRMLARLMAVPGVVAVASPMWSSVQGPVVGPEVRGAHALCDLAGGVANESDERNDGDDMPACCLSAFAAVSRPRPLCAPQRSE